MIRRAPVKKKTPTMYDKLKTAELVPKELYIEESIYEIKCLSTSFPFIEEVAGKMNVCAATHWRQCREQACEPIAAEKIGRRISDMGPNSSYGIKMQKDYMPMLIHTVNCHNLKSGLRILNHYEKLAKFKRTYVRPMGYFPERYKKDSALEDNLALLVSSSQWCTNIPFMSLYLMLVKIIASYPAKKGQPPLEYLKMVAETPRYKRRNSYSNIEGNLKKLLDLKPHLDVIEVIMKNRRELQNLVSFENIPPSMYAYNYLGGRGISAVVARVMDSNRFETDKTRNSFIGIADRLRDLLEG